MDRIDKLLNPPKWKPKVGEIVFTVKVGHDFTVTATKLPWTDNDKLLAKAFSRGIVFKYADEALACSRKLTSIIEILKDSNYGK